jgi:DNA-binding transcriptional LysR family regulator
MSNINLNWYNTFIEVVKSKSYSDTAERCNRSKSSISNDISSLESALGIKLFYRENNGVKLTTDGQMVYDLIDKGMGYINVAEKMVLQKNDFANAEIIIGSLSHLSSFYVMNCIEKAKKDYPNMKIKLLTGSSGKNLVELLENHKIDLAIDSTHMNLNNTSIKKEKLKEINNIFVSKENIKIQKIEELANYKFILGFENTTTSQELINYLKVNGVHIKPTLEIDITELRLDAVKKGLGIGYVMEDSAEELLKTGKIHKVELPLTLPKSNINLMYLKDHLSQSAKKFIEIYLKEK